MAARTTTKVAVQTGAAKDDLLTGLNEDALSMSFNVLANDPGSARLYSLLQAPDLSTPNAQFPVVTTALSTHGATLTMTADGMVAYDASSMSASLQQTAAGETFTDTFTYTIRMANGALSTAIATVEVAGTNDAPTLTLTGTGTYTITDTAADDTPPAITASLTGNDVDNGAILTYSTSGASDYGTLVAGEVAGTYDFIADANKIDELDADDTAQAVFSVIVTDENGAASAPVMLTFDLVGANDTAVISGLKTGAVTEDGVLTAGDSLGITDRDHDQSSFLVPASLAGTYGSFTFTTAGAWTYALNNGAANVQALAVGEEVSDSLAVKSFDGMTTETITVKVTGANDAPTLTLTGTGAYTITDTAADDTPPAITVSLTGNDVDHGATLTYSTSGASDYGTLVAGEVAGTYDFIADANKIDELDADDTAQAVFSVIVTDENGATSAPVMLTFNLVGANDTAEISGVKTGAVTEDGTLAAAGSLTVTDRDHDQSSFQVPADLVGDYGSFTFTSDGAWTYALDNAATNVQALAGGATVVDTLDVKSFDGLTTETITVTVTGAIDETTVTVTGGPTTSPVTTFMVNNGLSFVNNRTTITGFDANDLLNPANNYDYVSFAVTDTNNDSVVDATEVKFEFTFGQNSNLVTVVLVGYTAFTEAQVV